MAALNKRSFSVYEDRTQFKIEAKTHGRLTKHLKKLYVRGYPTFASAHRDIPRLDAHLSSKKHASTFEKHLGDDMDELLESRHKKPNQSQRRDGHDPTIAKALSGQVATQLRKKLNGSYHLFKMKLLSEGSPVISKEEWFKAHRTDLLPNYLELEQANQYRVSMTYIHQRLRLLSDQRMKGIARIKDLRNVIYSGKTYLMIREAEIATTDKDVIDLTETPPKYTFQSTTKAQLSRVNIQCFAVLNMMQQIEVKIDSEMTMLQGFLSDV